MNIRFDADATSLEISDGPSEIQRNYEKNHERNCVTQPKHIVYLRSSYDNDILIRRDRPRHIVRIYLPIYEILADDATSDPLQRSQE